VSYKRVEGPGTDYLYVHESSGTYYVKISRQGRGTLFETLDTKNKKTAIQLKDEKVREFLGHAQKKQIHLLFRETANAFLESYAATVKATTHRRITNAVKHHLDPYWGLFRLAEITPGEWNKYLNSQTGRTLSNDKKAMSLILRYAFGENKLEKVPKLTDPTDETDAGQEFTDDEILSILKCAPFSVRMAVNLAYKCGPRIGEIVGIAWSDINWKQNYITVSGKTGPRKMWVSSSVLDNLKRYRGLIEESKWVFPKLRDRSEHMTTNGLDNLWQSAKNQAGVTKRFHDLRHTAITSWLRQGKSVVWVAKQVGSSVRTIMKIYEHLDIKDIGELGEAVKIKGEDEFF